MMKRHENSLDTKIKAIEIDHSDEENPKVSVVVFSQNDSGEKKYIFDENPRIEFVVKVLCGKMSPFDGYKIFLDESHLHSCKGESDSDVMTHLLVNTLRQVQKKERLIDEDLESVIQEALTNSYKTAAPRIPLFFKDPFPEPTHSQLEPIVPKQPVNYLEKYPIASPLHISKNGIITQFHTSNTGSIIGSLTGQLALVQNNQSENSKSTSSHKEVVPEKKAKVEIPENSSTKMKRHENLLRNQIKAIEIEQLDNGKVKMSVVVNLPYDSEEKKLTFDENKRIELVVNVLSGKLSASEGHSKLLNDNNLQAFGTRIFSDVMTHLLSNTLGRESKKERLINVELESVIRNTLSIKDLLPELTYSQPKPIVPSFHISNYGSIIGSPTLQIALEANEQSKISQSTSEEDEDSSSKNFNKTMKMGELASNFGILPKPANPQPKAVVPEKKAKVKIPNAFYCPIDYELIKTPWLCTLDGKTYGDAIRNWLKEHRTSPNNRNAMRENQTVDDVLVKNYDFADVMEQFFKDNPEALEQDANEFNPKLN